MADDHNKDGVFAPVRPELNFPEDEARILAFWKANSVFEKTLSAHTRSRGPSKGTFVFYEGPPTANPTRTNDTSTREPRSRVGAAACRSCAR